MEQGHNASGPELLLLQSFFKEEDSGDRNATSRWEGNETLRPAAYEDYDYWEWTYPSGYSRTGLVLTSLSVTAIMVLIVVGNMLVCVAIATEKSLKTCQNWFIASLAVSDLLVGLVVMPFSLAKEVMGYWIFGRLWCEVHSALDVFLCTASINSLCLISLDRYWSVTHAVEYLRKRTPRRSLAMIAGVWALSAVISLPPLVGWRKKEGAEGSSDLPECLLSDDVGYVLYSACGSFYVPAFVMVFVYCRIFVAARSRARRHLRQRQAAAAELTTVTAYAKSTTTTTTTTCTTTSLGGCSPTAPQAPAVDDATQRNGTTTTPAAAPEIVIDADDDDDDEEEEEDEDRPGAMRSTGGDRLSPAAVDAVRRPSSALLRPRFLSKSPFGSTLSLADLSCRSASEENTAKLQSAAATQPQPSAASEAERQRRRVARARERRATLILGLIMASFILAWLPFFVLYVLEALCRASCDIGATAFAVAFWLGYCNSALNPIIYTIFNRDFRRAFRKILFK